MNNKALKKIQSELEGKATLIAVSKTHPKSEIDEAYKNGCTIFGENKVQEIKEKYDPNYTWHMIGHLQRNKVKDVVKLVDMIQSVDSVRLAQEIEKECAKIDKVMPILIEVNISREANKTGIFYEDCYDFVKYCLTLPHLKVEGLMCVGPLTDDEQACIDCFKKMQTLFNHFKDEFGEEVMQTLSMGMSDDYQLALQYGSNMVRIGSTIFGKRNYHKS